MGRAPSCSKRGVTGAVLPVHSQSYTLQQLASKLTLRTSFNTDQPVLLNGGPFRRGAAVGLVQTAPC
jgi:putative AlgH/UPF0301 family transcriptional regulator